MILGSTRAAIETPLANGVVAKTTAIRPNRSQARAWDGSSTALNSCTTKPHPVRTARFRYADDPIRRAAASSDHRRTHEGILFYVGPDALPSAVRRAKDNRPRIAQRLTKKHSPQREPSGRRDLKHG